MLRSLQSKANLRRPAWVSAEALNLAPDLLGAPLATPLQRLLAMGIDVALIGMLSSVDSFWLLMGLAVFFFQLRAEKRATRSWRRNALVWSLCALCLVLAFNQGKLSWNARGAPPQPPSGSSAPAADPAKTLDATAPDGEAKPTDAERIEALEAALAEARKPRVFHWQAEIKGWLENLGLGFGWAIVYFSVVPARLHGQSVGKKLLGLRVVEITGKPMTVLMCFSRYGGYAAGMATGMFGFAQMLWDPNRQAIQDKVAHTVVVDLGAPRQTPPNESPIGLQAAQAVHEPLLKQ